MTPGLPRRADVRLDELQRRFELSDAARVSLSALLALVAADDLAPTTVRDPAIAVDQHVADSLVALEVPAVRDAEVVADLGAGAGFPGLVLAAALPAATVALVESNRRKCEFIARAADVAGIGNAAVVNERVEIWADGRERHDLVTARALAAAAVVAEYAAPLLRLGGTLVAWTGRREPDLEGQGDRAASMLGLSPSRIVPVAPFRGAEHRHLTLMSKLSETPSRFPRRPGVARKRPLGATTASI